MVDDHLVVVRNFEALSLTTPGKVHILLLIKHPVLIPRHAFCHMAFHNPAATACHVDMVVILIYVKKRLPFGSAGRDMVKVSSTIREPDLRGEDVKIIAVG